MGLCMTFEPREMKMLFVLMLVGAKMLVGLTIAVNLHVVCASN
jgi:hypothetical protein